MKGCDFSVETSNCTQSNHTKEFLQQVMDTQDCINQPELTDKEVCNECAPKYDELNKIYNAIRVKTTDKFCFAIKDMVSVKSYIHFIMLLNSMGGKAAGR